MRSPDLTRPLLLAGVVGPVVFVAVFLVSTFGCGCWSPTSVPTGWPVGLFQRIAVVTGWTWVALLALRLRQAPA